MVTVGLWVRLEAKPGKEEDVARFLRESVPLVLAEPATTAWFAIRMGQSTFGIFDAFPDESGRQAHLAGRVASALKEKASELFAQPPKIENLDILAVKLPQEAATTQPRRRFVRADSQEERIPMQVGSEFRIKNNGELIVDNPELELAPAPGAADATLAYRFDKQAGEHIVRLLEPVADHRHIRVHRPDD